MIQVGRLIGFLVGVGREDVLRRVMREDNARAIFADEPDNGFARLLSALVPAAAKSLSSGCAPITMAS